MPAYIVQIARSGGQSLTNSRDSVLVHATTAAAAKSVAKNVRSAGGYTAAMWDAATATEIAAAADLEGFRLHIAVTPGDIDATVTAAGGETVHDMGDAMVVLLNAYANIAGASYDSGTGLLTVADDADDLGASTLIAEFLPPLSDTIYENPTTSIAGFITNVTPPGGTNEVQTIIAATAAYGTYTITYDGQTTSALAYDANAATVQAALIALSNLASGDVVVTGTSIVTGLTLTFGGTLASADIAEITATLTGLVLLDVAEDTAGDAGTNEVQRVTVDATGGDFTITFEGQTTSAIAFDADAATVELALEALSNIAEGEATCAGTLAGGMAVTFSGALGVSDRTQMTTNAAGLTGGASTATPTTTIAGAAPVDEVQSINVRGYSAGTFTATYSGQTTGNIARTATAGTVQTALRALSNIADTDVVCAGGPLGTAPVTVTFADNLAATNVDLITLDGSLLTAPAETIATSVIGGALTATLNSVSAPQAYNDPGLGL